MPRWKERKLPLSRMMWVRVPCKIASDGEEGVAEVGGRLRQYGCCRTRIPMQRAEWGIPMLVTLEGAGRIAPEIIKLRKGDVVVIRGYLQRRRDALKRGDDRFSIIVSSIRKPGKTGNRRQ